MIKIAIIVALCCWASMGLRMHELPNNYYTNIDVQNFVDGGVDGSKIYFSQITSDGNKLKCPFHRPFTTDGKKCFQCPIELPIFNIANSRCETCPTGVKGLKNHQCV